MRGRKGRGARGYPGVCCSFAVQDQKALLRRAATVAAVMVVSLLGAGCKCVCVWLYYLSSAVGVVGVCGRTTWFTFIGPGDDDGVSDQAWPLGSQGSCFFLLFFEGSK